MFKTWVRENRLAISACALVLFAVSLTYVARESFIPMSPQERAEKAAESFEARTAITKPDLFFWAKTYDFFGDSFIWTLPMDQESFVYILYLTQPLEETPLEEIRKQYFEPKDYIQFAKEAGYLPVGWEPSPDKTLTIDEAVSLVKNSLDKRGIPVRFSQLYSWVFRDKSREDLAELNWFEALSLLYNVSKFKEYVLNFED